MCAIQYECGAVMAGRSVFNENKKMGMGSLFFATLALKASSGTNGGALFGFLLGRVRREDRTVPYL